MTHTNRKLYRSKNGILLGICQGIADWKDMPVSIVRLIFIIICCATAVAPCMIAYLIAGFIIPVEPAYRDNRYRGQRWSDTKSSDIHEDFEDLKERVNKMEDEVTGNKESDWDKRFHSGK